MSTAKRSQRKMNKGGETQFLISKNAAEHHGDTQHSTILTGQMPGKEDHMDDYGRRLDAVASEKSDLVTNTDQGAVPSNAEVLEYESLLQYLIADIWRFYTAHIMHQGGGTSIIVVRKEKDKETWQKARKISYASLHGSSDILFVAEQDVPDMAPKEWLRGLVQERLAVTSKTLNIFLPTWLLKILIEDEE